jgi:RND superfamily putative drug exporter
MATLLYRLGLFSYRRRWLVTAVWLVVLAMAGVGAATLSGPTSDTFSIPGTESQQALDLVQKRMPGSGANAASARVVFVAKAGTVAAPGVKTAIEASVDRLGKLTDVASVTDPYASKAISRDGRTAYATVTYTVEAAAITTEDQDRLFAAGRSAESAGLRVEIGGDAAAQQSESGATEGIGLAVAAVVLVITFGSLLAFTSYAWLLQNAPISKVSTYAYVNPVVAIALGWLVLSEDITPLTLLGAGIIVASVALVVRVEARARPKTS